jgi:Tol biopolymer transport system component
VRQIASNSVVRIVPPEASVGIRSLAVTPDGSFVNYVRRGIGELTNSLWRVPFLGGPALKLIDDVETAPGWSPDGKQMAFVRRRRTPAPANGQSGDRRCRRIESTRRDRSNASERVRYAWQHYAARLEADLDARADSSGTNITLVVNIPAAIPNVAADGSSIVFVSSESGIQAPWTVNLDGTGLRQIVDMRSDSNVRISPDGRHIAFFSLPGEIVIASITGSAPPRHVRIDTPVGFSWTPDGQGVAYIGANFTDAWVQPIAGGKPRQLTRFTDRTITGFSWSPDGRRLAFSRATTTTDIVMLKGIR